MWQEPQVHCPEPLLKPLTVPVTAAAIFAVAGLAVASYQDDDCPHLFQTPNPSRGLGKRGVT